MVDALFLDDGRKQDFGIGSNPVLTTKSNWKVVEWLKAVDCKSTLFGVRGFESLPSNK